MRIPAPIPKEVGLGDVVKAGLSAVGIEQKQGCKCAERQAALNRLLSVGPRPGQPSRTDEIPLREIRKALTATGGAFQMASEGAAGIIVIYRDAQGTRWAAQWVDGQIQNREIHNA